MPLAQSMRPKNPSYVEAKLEQDDGTIYRRESQVRRSIRQRQKSELKSEIDDDMQIVQEKLDEVASKIRANIANAHNRDGLLLGAEKDYIDCLKVKHRELEELLSRDEAHWIRQVEITKREAGRVLQELQNFS